MLMAPATVCDASVMSTEQSDLSLVQLAQRGDAGAFDALVRRYQHKVVKLVLRYVRDPAEAEDIAQEAFIKGAVKFSGNHQLLIDAAELFAELNGVFEQVRARTDYR